MNNTPGGRQVWSNSQSKQIGAGSTVDWRGRQHNTVVGRGGSNRHQYHPNGYRKQTPQQRYSSSSRN